MRRIQTFFLLAAVCGGLARGGELPASWPGAQRSQELQDETLPAPFERLKKLYAPLAEPGPQDWLANHHEPGQSYQQYKAGHPARPTPEKTTIYIRPIGDFTPDQQRIVALTADFLHHYFRVPVKVQTPLPLERIPEKARRQKEADEQLLTRYILRTVLKPDRPADAIAYLGLTASDLWPGRGWDFVYGQASWRDGVGVWSLHRTGTPSASPAAFRQCLRRTLQIASHETGHILGLRHCLAYDCNMNGANHQAEADSRPLTLCPACLAKLCWNLRAEPKARYQELVLFTRKHDLEADSLRFASHMVVLP